MTVEIPDLQGVAVAGALKRLTEALLRDGVPDARSQAQWMMRHVLGCGSHALALRMSETLPDDSQKELLDIYRQRMSGRPLQYILGEAPFMGRMFAVGEGVLIPRMDTEILAQSAIGWLKKYPPGARLRALDLCCGTACVGISIACAVPEARVDAADLSGAALDYARRNARAFAPGVEIIQSDLFNAVGGRRYDVIACNPPYIPDGDTQGLMREVRDHEPREALCGGADGLDFYRRVIPEARAYLQLGGALMLEIGYGQGDAVSRMLEAEGYRDIARAQDLAGYDRVLTGAA